MKLSASLGNGASAFLFTQQTCCQLRINLVDLIGQRTPQKDNMGMAHPSKCTSASLFLDKSHTGGYRAHGTGVGPFSVIGLKDHETNSDSANSRFKDPPGACCFKWDVKIGTPPPPPPFSPGKK